MTVALSPASKPSSVTDVIVPLFPAWRRRRRQIRIALSSPVMVPELMTVTSFMSSASMPLFVPVMVPVLVTVNPSPPSIPSVSAPAGPVPLIVPLLVTVLLCRARGSRRRSRRVTVAPDSVP